jgi:hypothetical protein
MLFFAKICAINNGLQERHVCLLLKFLIADFIVATILNGDIERLRSHAMLETIRDSSLGFFGDENFIINTSEEY